MGLKKGDLLEIHKASTWKMRLDLKFSGLIYLNSYESENESTFPPSFLALVGLNDHAYHNMIAQVFISHKRKNDFWHLLNIYFVTGNFIHLDSFNIHENPMKYISIIILYFISSFDYYYFFNLSFNRFWTLFGVWEYGPKQNKQRHCLIEVHTLGKVNKYFIVYSLLLNGNKFCEEY